jgi:amino acid transporter
VVTDLRAGSSPPATSNDGGLIRGVGLWHATTLNMIDMIGVGPFVTMPLMIAAMHGPQAMIGWVLGAVLVVCDGLVWAELGAAMPRAGGPVHYLRAMYGPKAGGWLAFLFVFQLTFSAPLSMASGCIGFAQYAEYLWPALHDVLTSQRLGIPLPFVGTTFIDITITKGTFLAMATVATAVALLYRRITVIGQLGVLLWGGVVATTLTIIVSGALNFSAAQAFTFPPGAWTLSREFFVGLGAALLIAVYDYWGYYNVIASDFMARIWGPRVGAVVTIMMLWTAFASVFSLLLGYSRVPYAAALEGDYFKVFARVHPKHHFPNVSLLWLGAMAAVFCLFKLADVVTALVVIRISIQFLAQTIGVMVLRRRNPGMPRPFRMWLYPLPAILACLGFVYIIVMRPKSLEAIRLAAVVVVVGTILFWLRRRFAERFEGAGGSRR